MRTCRQRRVRLLCTLRTGAALLQGRSEPAHPRRLKPAASDLWPISLSQGWYLSLVTHRGTSTRAPRPPASLPECSVRPRSTWRSRKRCRSALGWRDGLASLPKTHTGHSATERRAVPGCSWPSGISPAAPAPTPAPPPCSPRGREAGLLLRTSCLRSEQRTAVSQPAPLCSLPAPFWYKAGSPCGGGMTKEQAENTEKPPSAVPNSTHTGGFTWG